MRRLAPVTVALGLSALVACGSDEEPPRAPFEARAAELSLEELPQVVEGELRGEPFRAGDAFYRVERHPLRERIDLFFVDGDETDCALPLAREGRRVFFRLPGRTEPAVGEVVADPGEPGDPSAHYEWMGDDGARGVGRGAFRLRVDGVTGERVRGVVHACFDDGRGSCVSGAFEARPCHGPIDGLAIRETHHLGDPRQLAREAPSAPAPDAAEGQED